jgi:hypothetical protein
MCTTSRSGIASLNVPANWSSFATIVLVISLYIMRNKYYYQKYKIGSTKWVWEQFLLWLLVV